jgi:multisubunit Na+/H+ antiporter MnhC subunit
MTQSPRANTQTTDRPPTITKGAILLLLTIADTTWRAFVPTIGGTILGVTLDNALGTAPVVTTISIIVGFAVSALLITLQIRAVRKTR